MATGWIWAAVGLALMAAEALAPGVFLLWIGLAALVTGGVAGLFGGPLELHLAVFSAAVVAFCVLGWLVYRNRGGRPARRHVDETVNDPRAALVGSTGEVAEAIRHGNGRVRIGDTLWLAQGPDLPVGAAVRVRDLTGNVIKVEALPG